MKRSKGGSDRGKSKTVPADSLKATKAPDPAATATPIKPKKLSKQEKAKLAREAQKLRRSNAKQLEQLAPIAPPAPTECNDEELRFVLEYLKHLNGAKAIVDSGIHEDPKVAKVYASRYLDREHVIQELARRRGDLIAKQELSLERVNEELRRIGMANLSDVASWDGETLWLNPKAELTPEQLSAIAEIEEIPGMYGSRLAIKMHDKKGALVALQQHLSPSPAERRFGAGGANGGSATIILEGGPTGLEVTVSVSQAGQGKEDA